MGQCLILEKMTRMATPTSSSCPAKNKSENEQFQDCFAISATLRQA